jgi:hypothetical protein
MVRVFLWWKDRVEIGKNSGFSLQKRAVNLKGMDLIRRISIQRLGSNAARLTGKDQFDWGQVVTRAVGWPSGGPG